MKTGRVGCGCRSKTSPAPLECRGGTSGMYPTRARPCPHATPQPCFCSLTRRTCPRPGRRFKRGNRRDLAVCCQRDARSHSGHPHFWHDLDSNDALTEGPSQLPPHATNFPSAGRVPSLRLDIPTAPPGRCQAGRGDGLDPTTERQPGTRGAEPRANALAGLNERHRTRLTAPNKRSPCLYFSPRIAHYPPFRSS